jgi:RND family efflux transporter MFP subunit
MVPVILFTLTACEEKTSAKEMTKTLRSVKYITVQPSKTGRTHTYFGSSKALLEATLSFRVNGIIEDIAVKVGDTLKKGSFIASLDKISFELEVEKARASLAQAQADRRNSESKYQRKKELYENNNASKSDLDSARASVESARASVRSAKKSLKLTQLDLGYTKLKSSDDCSIAEVFKEVNENVKAGENIVSITCGKSSEVEISIPENLIGSIKKGMPAMVQFDSIADTKFSAKVSEVSVSSASGVTYPVTLAIDNQDHQLRSGLAAEVTFTFSGAKDTAHIYLPPVSVGEDTKGRYVFVLKAAKAKDEGIIHRQGVTIGELTSQGLEIIDGIKPEQKVVIGGMSVIYDGLVVKAE